MNYSFDQWQVFLRITLKKSYPRLPICITADGLYPNQHFFAICLKNDWDFIVTLKDGNLSSLQEEIELLRPLTLNSYTERIITHKNARTTQTFRWMNGLEYKNTPLHWIECIEETSATVSSTVAAKKTSEDLSRFVHVTNLEITSQTAC